MVSFINVKETPPHIPVLLDESLELLKPEKGESYLDLTAGYGGHAQKVLERTLQPSTSILVDRDRNAVDYLHAKFKDDGVQIIQSDFLSASQELTQANRQFDIILADLGVSSLHLDSASRGFSLKKDGPLDMRMDQTQSLTAADIVNGYTEAELSELIREYGEEPKRASIARNIVEHRPIKTTSELADVVTRAIYPSKRVSRSPHAWPGHSKVHPATKTFQALRIAVNSELDQLEKALPLWIDLLSPGGRIAVISFHSLEDRIVKQAFKEKSGDRYDAVLGLLTKRPVTAGEEIVFNPRARSAKLRAAVKINKNL